MTTKRSISVAMLLAALVVSGCANTIRGVGQDAANSVNAVESAGNNVANATR